MNVRLLSVKACPELHRHIGPSNTIPDDLRFAKIEKPTAYTDEKVQAMLTEYGSGSKSHRQTRRSIFSPTEQGTGKGDQNLETPITALKPSKNEHYLGIFYTDSIREIIEPLIISLFSERPIARL